MRAKCKEDSRYFDLMRRFMLGRRVNPFRKERPSSRQNSDDARTHHDLKNYCFGSAVFENTRGSANSKPTNVRNNRSANPEL